MPVVKTRSGWKAYSGSPTTFKTRAEAEAQLAAIEASKATKHKRSKPTKNS